MQNIAVVCPGQGSQSVGMMTALSEKSDLVQLTFVEASESVGFDLWELVNSGPEEQLNLTQNTQPALVAASVAAWRVLQEQLADQGKSFQPSYFAGHSLGEFSALVLSGAMSLKDAVKVVQQRGKLMSEALEPGIGGMVAVLGLDEASIREICEKTSTASQSVSLANINAPGQIVLAGHVAALEKAAELCKSAGAKRAVMLPVSGPFHSPLICSAAEGLQIELTKVELNTPSAPIIQNVTNAHEVDVARIRANLVQQVTHPVNWVQAVESMQQNGVETLLEVGPGKVLTGLNKRINRSLNLNTSETPDAIQAFVQLLN